MALQLAKIGGYLDGIFICPHRSADNCACRKPNPGLFLQIAEHFRVTPSDMLSVGDSLGDLLAAKVIGCEKNILVKTGNGTKTLIAASKNQSTSNPNDKLDTVLDDVLVCDNLAEAVKAILLF